MIESKSATRSNLPVAVAIAGVLAYLIYFFSLKLPNAHVPGTAGEKFSGLDVWQLAIPGVVPDSSCLASQALQRLADFSHIAERVPVLGYAILIGAAALGLGSLILQALSVGVEPSNPRGEPISENACAWPLVEWLVAAFGIGMSALSLCTLGLGLMGWMNRVLVLASLITTIAIWVVWLWRRRTAWVLSKSPSTGAGGQILGFGSADLSVKLAFAGGAIAVVLFLAIDFLGAMLPATDFDVREYHLQGPKEFYLAGRIGFVPHNVYMNMPFGTEMLTLLGMIAVGDWWWGALVGQTVLAMFAPMTALGIWALGRRLFSPTAGWLAALFYLTTPWVHRISIIPYTENALCFFMLAATLAIVMAHMSGERGGPNRAWLIAGIFAGSAVACKYPALLSTVFPLAIVALAQPLLARFSTTPPLPSSSPRSGFRSLILLTVGLTAACGPWLLKNALLTGNPTYPLLYRVFGGRNWTPEKNAKWEWGHRVALLVAAGVQLPPDDRPVHGHDPQHAITLRRLKENFIDVTAQADWLNPLLFGFAPLSFFAARGRAAAGWLWLLVAYLFFQWWLLTHRLDRFWVPLIPIAAVLAGAGATWRMSRVWTAFVSIAVGVVVFFNFSYCTSGLCGDNRYSAALVRCQDPTDAMINWLNGHRVPDRPEFDRVLAVGAADLFHLDRPVIYNTVFDDCIFEQVANDPAGVRAALDRLKVRYVYVNWSEIRRYREPGSYGFTDAVRPRQFRALVESKVLIRVGPAGGPIVIDGEVVPSSELYSVNRGPWND